MAVRWWDEIIAGGVSGMAGIAIGHPLDTVKLLMQTNPSFTNPLSCLRRVVLREGLRGLFKGIIPPLSIATSVNAITFYAYEFSLRFLRRHSFDADKTTTTQIFLAGSFSGFLQCFVSLPAEVVA